MRNDRKVKTDMFCENDPRSVAAMLRGTGDGREKRYARFVRKAFSRDPDLTNEEVARMYEDACDIGFEDAVRLERQLRVRAIIGRAGFHLVGVCAAFLALKYFFG